MYFHLQKLARSTTPQWNYLGTEYSPNALFRLDGYASPNWGTDLSGDGYHLTAYGASLSAVPPMYYSMGNGITGFSSYNTSAHIKQSAINPNLIIYGPVTIQAILLVQTLVTIDGNPPANIPVVSFSGDSSGTDGNALYTMNLHLDAGAGVVPSFQWETGSTRVYVSFNQVHVEMGVPFHIAMTRTGTAPNISCSCYINGKLEQTVTTASAAPTIGTSSVLHVGGTEDGTSYKPTNMTISSIKINNTALSSSQILAEYKRIVGA